MKDSHVVSLPEPVRKGDSSFEELVAERESKRSFKSAHLTLTQLSQLLWAAYGPNAAGGMKRDHLALRGKRSPLRIH